MVKINIKELNLMDAVHRFTYNGYKHIKTSPKQMSILTKYRTELRRAHKFVLDESVTELLAELSLNREKVHFWSVLARLPYDVVWIEYPTLSMLRVFERTGTLKDPIKPDEISPISGYLLVREGETRWWATEFIFSSFEDEIFTQPICFLFDPDGVKFAPTIRSSYWRSLPLQEIMGNIPAIIEGGEHIEVSPQTLFLGVIDYSDEVVLHSEIEYKINAFVEPLWAEMSNFQKNKNALINLLGIDVRERTGVLRRLITILATINHFPEGIVSRKGKEGTIQTRKNLINYFDYSVIQIKVPKKKNVVEFLTRKLNKISDQIRKRRHNVRGHWRLLKKKTGKAGCQHIPLKEAINGVAECSICGLKIKWVDKYERGDATLGWVYQEHQIKK